MFFKIPTRSVGKASPCQKAYQIGGKQTADRALPAHCLPVNCCPFASLRHNSNVLAFGQCPCKTVTRGSSASPAKVQTRHWSPTKPISYVAVKSSLQQRACKLGAFSLGSEHL